MRIIAVISLVAALTFSLWAAQTPAPTVKVVSATDLAAIIAKQPKDKNGNQTFIDLAPYNVNMEHRVVGQGASVHEREAELFYVIDGSGTLVTGGKLVEEKRTNEANLSGTSITGGATRKVSKGDWILVPEGVPHQFPAVETLTLMSVHLPRK